MENLNYKNEDFLNQTVTMSILMQYTHDVLKPTFKEAMLEYTDEFLIPRFSEMMDEKMDKRFNEFDIKLDGKVTHELKAYIDQKLAEQTSDIFQRIDKKDKPFKRKVVDVFVTSRLATDEEITFLQGLT